jgi:GTP cyclohydrolase II
MHTPSALRLHKAAEADFPTRFGHFRIYGFEGRHEDRLEEAVVLEMGDVAHGALAPLVRIHSQCLTGDVFHSLRCDCRAQLELALHMIAEEGPRAADLRASGGARHRPDEQAARLRIAG